MDLIERVARPLARDGDYFGSDIDWESCSLRADEIITEAFTIPTDPSEDDRQRYQALCDALDAAGYRPTGWVEPPAIR